MVAPVSAGPLRAVAYCRVSTDRQEISIEAQKDQVAAMATVKGVELLDVIVDDGQSAKNLDRPGAKRLLEMVDAGLLDMVIIAKLDRLTRSVRDLTDLLERFAKHGVSLVSVGESLDTNSAAGRLILNVMASISQWEREVIGERTRTALAKLRSMGKFTGKPRYGWRSVGKGLPVVEDPSEQENIETIRRMRGNDVTFRHIADFLNATGRTVRSGAPWSVNDVQRVAKAEVS